MRPSPIRSTFLVCTAVAATAVATAGTASADQTAREKIDQLQAEGFTVNVDRVGSGPLDRCAVTGVRNPQTQTRNVRDYYGPRDANGDRKYRIVEVVVSRSISVSLDCTD